MSGGLGNQMFQYALGRAIAISQKRDLVLDTWSGFVRDKLYKRTYALSLLNVQARRATQLERLPLWLYRLKDKLMMGKKNMLPTRFLGHTFYVESRFFFDSRLVSHRVPSGSWYVGYWQSPKYFQSCEAQIRNELTPPTPSDKKVLALAELIHASESIALGIRLYEEATDPAAHSLTRLLKTPEEIREVVQRLKTQLPNGRILVFSTHRSAFLEQLGLPEDTIYVTPDDGYADTLACLWLLTRCKHHIFTNSSYYWWGAWLSQANYKKEDQLIYAADNFINVDGLCDHWQRF